MDFCGYLWIFVDINGDICGQLEDTRGSLWIFVDLCGSLWIFVDICGYLWIFVDIASSLIYMLVGLCVVLISSSFTAFSPVLY